MCRSIHDGCIRNPCIATVRVPASTSCLFIASGTLPATGSALYAALVAILASESTVYAALGTLPATGGAVYAALVSILASESTVYAALSSAVHACFKRHVQQHFSYCAYSVLTPTTGSHMLSRPELYTPDLRNRHMLKDQQNDRTAYN